MARRADTDPGPLQERRASLRIDGRSRLLNGAVTIDFLEQR